MTMKYRKRSLIVFIITTLLLVSSQSAVFAASGPSVSGYNTPSTISQGSKYTIKGKIKSSKKIKKVTVGIAKANGKWTSYKYTNKRVNSKSFSLSKAAKTLKFNKLKKGTYYYKVTASTSNGKTKTLINQPFTVTDPPNKPGKITLSGVSEPSKQIEGKPFSVKGKITTSKKIKTVVAGVVDRNGNWTPVKASKTVNATTFKLKKVDSKLKFGTLGEGDYFYRIDVYTTGGHKTVLNKPFTVVSNIVPETTDDNTAVAATNGGDVVTLYGLNKPGTYNVGATFNPVGQIRSTETIKRVEAGIVFAPTNKWLSHKYDKTMSTKTFNVADAAGALRFDLLPGGDFRYRIYVHTDKGVYLALNHKFTVKPSGKPQAAVNWAKNIAADNSFAYGKVPTTSRVGCYFCGTNQKNKPKGYEKTYVCMTFVHAAYAHGAGDPEILKDCKGGKYCLSLNDKVFKEYACWEKIGLCKDLKVEDLQPGDVICWYAADDKSGHLSLYAGNGDIVDAGRVGWGADSIALRAGSASNYLKKGASFNKKSFVMRYRK